MSARTICSMLVSLPIAHTCAVMILATSMPVGRVIFSMRLVTMNTAFTITARVKAICRATSTAPVLLRSIAINIGRNSIGASSLRLQERRGRHAAHAPRGVQPGRETREQRDGKARAEHVEVEMRVAIGLLEHGLHATQADPGEHETEQTAGDADDADFHQVLAEDRGARRAEGAAQAD